MKKIVFAALLCSLFGRTMAQVNATMAVSPRSPFQKEFGNAVSMGNGNKYVVGTEFDGRGTGTVTLFEGKTALWTKSGYEYGAGISRFGKSVAYDPGNLIVGAPTCFKNGQQIGRVYIFAGNNGTFDMSAPLQVLEHNKANSKFGTKVAIMNEILVVGSQSGLGGNNGVYIYKKEGPSSAPWVLKDSIKGTGVGESFALTQSHMIIGQPGNYPGKGTVRIFHKEWNGFVEKYNRTSTLPSWATHRYGCAVDIHNETIIIGDPLASKAEVLRYTPWQTSCTTISTLSSPIGSSSFGAERVAIKDNYALVVDPFCTPGYGSAEKGRVYAYYSENPWNNMPYVFKNLLLAENTNILSTKISDISLSEDGNIVIGMPHSNYPTQPFTRRDQGVVFFGNLANLTKESTTAYEPNNDFESAKPIFLHEPAREAISYSGDVDYYKLELTEALWIQMQLSGVINCKIELYNSNNTFISRSPQLPTYGSQMMQAQLSAGTYYIKVYGVSGAHSNALYRLDVSAVSCYDVLGTKNNSFATALEFDRSNVSLYSSIKTAGERDWYRMPNMSGNLNISLSNLTADFDLFLFNQNNSVVTFSNRAGSNSENINITGLPLGDYYIQVFGYGGATSLQCYQLDVVHTQNSSRVSSDEVFVSAPEISKMEFRVFPSIIKSGQSVNIAGSGDLTDQPLQVIELGTGRVIIQQQVSGNEVELKLPELTPGMYLINAGEKGKAKFVVQ